LTERQDRPELPSFPGRKFLDIFGFNRGGAPQQVFQAIEDPVHDEWVGVLIHGDKPEFKALGRLLDQLIFENPFYFLNHGPDGPGMDKSSVRKIENIFDASFKFGEKWKGPTAATFLSG
jgi:hypothetical protein